MSELKESVYALIAESPKFHDWGAGLQSGGIEAEILTTMVDYMLDEFGEGQFTSLETGAGLSTLIAMACKPKLHIVVNPDEPLKDRIFAGAEQRGISTATTNYLLEFSENVLPDLAKTTMVDMAFIDGGHGWPAVFVDFCYANMMLREGGIMVVDDIILFPCMQLFLLLKHQPEWELEKTVYSKTAFFRKKTSARLMGDFGSQPYLLNNILFK